MGNAVTGLGTGLYLASLDIYSICANCVRRQPAAAGVCAAPVLSCSLLGNRYHAAMPDTARNNWAKTKPTRKSSS